MFKFDIFNKKKVKEQDEIIKGYRKRCDTQKEEIEKLKKEVRELKIENSSDELHNHLCNENKKLIDWIRKILDEVGTVNVDSTNTFKIPVYKKVEEKAYDTIFPTIVVEETITIPEIIIHKGKVKK